MKVALDTRPLTNLSAGRGIGVYTAHLLRYLKLIPGLEMVELKAGEVPAGVDLLHYPYFDLYYPTLPARRSLPTVVTVHDITPIVLKELYPVGLRGKFNHWLQKRALMTVEQILTDSECSRQDIMEYFDLHENKVTTVYLGPQDGLEEAPGERLMEKVKEKYVLPEEHVLYVGDVNMNKNLLNLVAACKVLAIPLVIVGKQAVQTEYDHEHAETRDLVRLQRRYGNDPMVRRVGFVPLEELGVFYRLATAYCQPSLYEGFGVCVVEAMVSGCPVVSAKTGSLQEVGGKAAIYTDPTKEKLAKALELVRNLSPVQRKRLIQDGKKQARQFNWQATAERTFEVYKEVLGRK